jgi:hypothetical protein
VTSARKRRRGSSTEARRLLLDSDNKDGEEGRGAGRAGPAVGEGASGGVEAARGLPAVEAAVARADRPTTASRPRRSAQVEAAVAQESPSPTVSRPPAGSGPASGRIGVGGSGGRRGRRRLSDSDKGTEGLCGDGVAAAMPCGEATRIRRDAGEGGGDASDGSGCRVSPRDSRWKQWRGRAVLVQGWRSCRVIEGWRSCRVIEGRRSCRVIEGWRSCRLEHRAGMAH